MPPSPNATHDSRYDEPIDDLAYSYEGVFSRQTVAAAVHAARTSSSRRRPSGCFLPVLVARQAREQLMSTAQADGRIAKDRARAAVRVRAQRRPLPDGHSPGRAPLSAPRPRPLRRGRHPPQRSTRPRSRWSRSAASP